MHNIKETKEVLLASSRSVKSIKNIQSSNNHNHHINNSITTKISLIIPTYFEENILEGLLIMLDTDLRRKYNFEVIVSDGGSTDATLNIANKYADKVVTAASNEKQTIASGRNAGSAVAIGDVFVFLNADCKPANLTKFFDVISNWIDIDNNTFGAIACKVKAFDEEELLRDKIFYLLHNNYVRFLNSIGMGMGRGECQVVKKQVFENIGGYNSSLAAGEDFDLYRRIVKSGKKIKFSEELLVLESPRRFRKYGYLKTLWYWTLNSLTVMFWNKSASKEWETIR